MIKKKKKKEEVKFQNSLHAWNHSFMVYKLKINVARRNFLGTGNIEKSKLVTVA